jgi:signal transduction histidine kinase
MYSWPGSGIFHLSLNVRISLEDNGIGIAPDDHERIFRLLDRLHPEQFYEVTGLGLASVRKAIVRMTDKSVSNRFQDKAASSG